MNQNCCRPHRFVIKLLLLLNSSDSDVEISERLHQLADDLPDQGTVIE